MGSHRWAGTRWERHIQDKMADGDKEDTEVGSVEEKGKEDG